MKLELLDIDRFIEKNKLMEVKTSNLLNSKNEFDPTGLWSETIFGLQGSNDRISKFGYVNLHTNIIHPTIYNILINSSLELKKLIQNKKTYSIDTKSGKLIEDDKGGSGIIYFFKNIQNINLTNISKPDKLKDINFVLNNQDKLFIDKWLIIPAGLRDMEIRMANHQNKMSEINSYYHELLEYTSMNIIGNDDEIITSTIQNCILKINYWIKSNMTGKFGLFRGTILRKITDYSGNSVIIVDPNIELGKIGIPWFMLFVVYEPLMFKYIIHNDKTLQNYILKFMQADELSIDILKEFSTIVNKNPENINESMKELIIADLEEITKGIHILFKRNPVMKNRTSWRSAEVIITKNKACSLNPVDLVSIGGDIDGDTISFYPVFTKEAQEEAKNINPKYNKSILQSANNYNKLICKLIHDSVASIYTATSV